MRQALKWFLLASVPLLTLWAGAYSIQNANHELFPWIADNGIVVWQELLQSRRTDLFQVPVSIQPDNSVGINAYPSLPQSVVRVPAARPQISADGRWLVYYDGQEQVRLWDLTQGSEVQLIIRWQDMNGDGFRDPPAQPKLPKGILPAISGGGRFVAFLSKDPDLHDPNGEGSGTNPYTLQSNDEWFLYLHDRDADLIPDVDNNGQNDVQKGKFDETPKGATTTKCLGVVKLAAVRLSLDAPSGNNNDPARWLVLTQRSGSSFEVRYADITVPSPTLQPLVTETSPISVPSVAGNRVAFSVGSEVRVYDLSLGTPQLLLRIQTNGVNGAPVLSRDGNWVAFHSTMTAYQVNGGNRTPLPNKRNAVDDVFVFSVTGAPFWSSLAVRNVPTNSQFGSQFGPIGLFTPCVNPASPRINGNSIVIAFQEIANGRSQVRIVDTSVQPPNSPVLR